MPQSPDIGQNSDGGISDFRISGQSLMKENCHKSRTGDDIDMKLRPVTKFNKRNKPTSKNCDLTSCREVVTSLSFLGFLANLEQSGCRIPETVCKSYVFSNSDLLSYKNGKQNYKVSNTTHTVVLSKGTFLDKKR